MVDNSLGYYSGERGRPARCFWRPAKNLRPPEYFVYVPDTAIVSRKARDTAGEAPALPRSCRNVFIQLEEQ
jgi:hypothetical protein